MSVNRVTLLGRLGTDPTLELLGDRQVPHCRLRLAVERRQGDTTVTDWVTVHTWQDQAQNCARYTGKGGRVYVEAHLSMASWTNKAGERRSRLEVVADRVVFLDRPAGGEEQEPPPEAGEEEE